MQKSNGKLPQESGLSRRRLIEWAPGLLAMAALPGSLRAEDTLRAPHVDTLYTADRFLPLVASSFGATLDGRQTWLTLLSVDQMSVHGSVPRAATGPALNTFILTFQGADEGFPQGTYQLTHSGGSFPLFLVPAGPFLYTATICRLISPRPLVK